MRNFLLPIFILSLLVGSLKAQVNMDTPSLSFEKGFQNWKLEEGNYYLDNASGSYVYGDWKTVSSQTTRRFLILNNTPTTTDTILRCSNFMTNPSGVPVARIGTPLKCEGYTPGNLKAAAERLTYEYIVTPNSTLLTYKLAAVLNSPVGTNGDDHQGPERPGYRVDINVYEPSGAIASPAPSCSRVEILADTANHNLGRSPKCNSSAAGTNAQNYVYQNWISGNINLSNYIGYKVIITITNHDCLSTSGGKLHAGAHEAYGYFWAETKGVELSAFSCDGSNAEIWAPAGFDTYNWRRSDSYPFTVDPNNPRHITIDKLFNTPGTKYYCDLVDNKSMCGSITLETTIKPVKLYPKFGTKTLAAGKIQFTDSSTVVGDSITEYSWNFGDGSTISTEKNPIHEYTSFDPVTVWLTVISSKGCSKTIQQTVIPTRELIADIFPPANLQYNGQPKTFTDTVNVKELERGFDYFIVYTSKPGTPFYKSYTAPTQVGSYNATFVLSPLQKPRYEMKLIPSKDFEITPASLTVVADSLAKTYGQTYTLTGSEFTVNDSLYARDRIDYLKLSCKGLSDTASVSSTPYEITIDSIIGSGLRNYTITPLKGKLTVTPKGLAIHAIDNSKTYGDTVFVSGKEFYIDPRDLVKGDTVKSVSLKCDGFSRTAAAGGDSIRITGITFARQANYVIDTIPAYLTINKKKITVTARKCSKMYGATYKFSKKDYTFDATQLIGNDRIDSVPMTSDATRFNAPVRSDYPITMGTPDGNRLKNYTIYLSSDSVFEVIRKPITITAKDTTKVYGDIMAFKGTEFSTDVPLVAGDIISSVSLQSDGSGKNYSVGSYEITSSSATGKGTSNYDFNTYKSGTLKVLAKEIKPQLIAPKDPVYNASRKDITVTIPGVDELTATILSATPTAAEHITALSPLLKQATIRQHSGWIPQILLRIIF